MLNHLLGLELLATAVLVLDRARVLLYINPAAENMLGLSSSQAAGMTLDSIFVHAAPLHAALNYAVTHNASFTEHELSLETSSKRVQVSGTVSPLDSHDMGYIVEFHAMDQQLKIARDERMLLQQQANRELIRNLAHEIKNPLGGIRGAAQLLEHELPKETREYTQVIIHESDRLQSLMDRLLTPHRMPQISAVNIVEVLERVRSLVLAETPHGLLIRRDYDTSIPEITGDREQLIQATLNIVRNAVQALQGKGAHLRQLALTSRVVALSVFGPCTVKITRAPSGGLFILAHAARPISDVSLCNVARAAGNSGKIAPNTSRLRFCTRDNLVRLGSLRHDCVRAILAHPTTSFPTFAARQAAQNPGSRASKARTPWKIVVWSRLPRYAPMRGRLHGVSFRISHMAFCRAATSILFFRSDFSASGVMPNSSAQRWMILTAMSW